MGCVGVRGVASDKHEDNTQAGSDTVHAGSEVELEAETDLETVMTPQVVLER